MRFVVIALGLAALSACGTLENTGQTFEVDGTTHQLYAVNNGAAGRDYRVHYRQFTIFCDSLTTCEEEIAEQQRHIDLIYRAAPD